MDVRLLKPVFLCQTGDGSTVEGEQMNGLGKGLTCRQMFDELKVKW